MTERSSPDIESAIICALIDASKKHVIKLHEHDIGILARAVASNLRDGAATPSSPVGDDGRIRSYAGCPACKSSSTGPRRSCTAGKGCFNEAARASGWVLVPKEPTDAMCEAMLSRIEDAEAGRGAPFKWPDIEHMFDVYTDAIAAAPACGDVAQGSADPLKQPQYIIEGIILRRLHEKRVDGYTLEMAKEIAEALAIPSTQSDSAVTRPHRDTPTTHHQPKEK